MLNFGKKFDIYGVEYTCKMYVGLTRPPKEDVCLERLYSTLTYFSSTAGLLSTTNVADYCEISLTARFNSWQ